METFIFGPENKLRIFPPNSYKFKPKDHIILDEVQECILDNFWFQYNNKREEKGYMLSILNSLAEYFNKMNTILPISEDFEAPQQRPIYVLYEGKNPGIYITFELLIAEKIEAKYNGGISWKKYISVTEALNQARKILGVNYYIEPAAKEYIQKQKRAYNKHIPTGTPIIDIKDEGTSSKKSYKECLTKGVDPLDGEYIDWKLQETLEKLAPLWKKNIKEEILKELRKEMKEQFDNMKKEYDEKYDINNFLDDDTMEIGSHEGKVDIRGHGQNQE